VPVLAVPPGARTGPHGTTRLESVLCAVDFSEPSARAVDYCASIAAAAGARLVLAHALEWLEETETRTDLGPSLPSSEDDALARLNELVTQEIRERCAPELVVGYGAPSDEILRFVHERHVMWSLSAFADATRSMSRSLGRRHDGSFVTAPAPY